MRHTIVMSLIVTSLVAAAPSVAPADGNQSGASSPGVAEDPAYTEGVRAVKRGDYPAAIKLFESVVMKDGRNADAYNWLGYSIRQTGDTNRAIPLYEKALTIDPKHRGAHEYIGEAYLILGDLPKAKEHLAALDKLCFLPCEQYADLKKAVRAYEESGGKVKPGSK